MLKDYCKEKLTTGLKAVMGDMYKKDVDYILILIPPTRKVDILTSIDCKDIPVVLTETADECANENG